MRKKYNFLLAISALIIIPMIPAQGQGPEFYPISPVPFTKVRVIDNFWSGRLDTNRNVTIPYAFNKCEETGRILNFKLAAGITESDHVPRRGFDDSDVYKIMEGAAYSLAIHPDRELEAYLDTLIMYIAQAQEDDGYLYTVRTIMADRTHRDLLAPRWSRVELGSHELYNLGHMYEAAIAHYMATGKRNFLDVALKSANLVSHDFGPGKLEMYPGHQEIELALVKLYTLTGNRDYLELAKFFLDARGKSSNTNEYFQGTHKVTEQFEAGGHAVRAGYMYTAMADVAALTEDSAYMNALDHLWNDVAGKKLYITGGVGPGSGHGEGFGPPYFLPNAGAYCETCASIANAFWNYRMFLASGNAKYMDVFERALYNNVLSGVSLTGDRFFYPNKLETAGELERSEWFNVPCCPANICRFIPSVPGYIYATDEQSLFVNLFISSETDVSVNKNNIRVLQESEVPWGGKVKIRLNPESNIPFALRIRIPGWASGNPVPTDLYKLKSPLKGKMVIRVNGRKVGFKTENGYAVIYRTWKSNDLVDIDFPYEVLEIIAHPKVEADIGKLAFQAGPVVYCLEWPESAEGKVRNLLLNRGSGYNMTFSENILGGIMTINGKASALETEADGSIVSRPVSFTAIPYYAWAHRGEGEMTVWVPFNRDAATPSPFPTLENTSKLSGSGRRQLIYAVNDGKIPNHSRSDSVPNYNWWPKINTTGWLEYHFPVHSTISGCRVFWFMDAPGGGCDLPTGWKILYRLGEEWKEVNATQAYQVLPDKYCEIRFEPVQTDALRLEVTLGEKSAGIFEWELIEE